MEYLVYSFLVGLGAAALWAGVLYGLAWVGFNLSPTGRRYRADLKRSTAQLKQAQAQLRLHQTALDAHLRQHNVPDHPE